MLFRSLIAAMTLVTTLCVLIPGARAWDDAAYPNFEGQWRPIGGPGRWDPTKPPNAQQAPLTPEYQAIYEANLKDQAAGGQGTTVTYKCLSPGMPRVANVYGPMEIVVTPETTYLLIDHILDDRRIFTDGREWPKDLEPSYLGYSIGKWISTKGDGHSTFWRPRPAASKVRVPTTAPGFRCTTTMRASLRNAFTLTRAIPISPMTRSGCLTTR